MSSYNKFSLNRRNFVLIVLSLSAWFGLRPYFILNHDLFLSVFIYTSFILVIVYNKFSSNQNTIIFAVLFLIISFYFSIPGEGSVNKSISFGFLSAGIVAFLKVDDRIRLFEIFQFIYIITLLPSLLIYFLDISGINIPYVAIQGYKEEIDFYAFLGNVKTSVLDGFNVYRFQGMYDEPGIIGTFSGLLLLIDNFNFGRKKNYILLISGIVSFSMAFYLLVLLYVFFVKRLNSKYLIAISIFIVLLFSFNVTKFYIVAKFSYDISKNRYRFDNRVSTDFKLLYNMKITNGDLEDKLFGYGANAHAKNKFNVSSYKVLIYNKGFFGFLSLIIFYILYFRFYIKELSNRFIILIFLTSLYHRPDAITIYYSILFFGGVTKIHKQELINIYTKLKFIT